MACIIFFFYNLIRYLIPVINSYSWCLIWNRAVVAVFGRLFTQRLVVLNSIIYRIFDTIIATLIDFVLREILMFFGTIRISKKKFQLRLDILFCSYHFLFFNGTKTFFDATKTYHLFDLYVNCFSKIPHRRLFDHRTIYYGFNDHVTVFLDLLKVFNGLSLYLFSSDVIRGQHNIKDVLDKMLARIRIFFR